jgi:hypothetical protein
MYALRGPATLNWSGDIQDLPIIGLNESRSYLERKARKMGLRFKRDKSLFGGYYVGANGDGYFLDVAAGGRKSNPGAYYPPHVMRAVVRISGGDPDGANWEFFHGMTATDREAVDTWIVETKHPLGFQAGTQEGRFKKLVREALEATTRNPGAALESVENPGEPWAPKTSIPGLSAWSMFAGGTGAEEGKHGYSLTTDIGNYKIQPFSSKTGRHIGYEVWFENVKGTVAGGLNQPIGSASHPSTGVGLARKHYQGLRQGNPRFAALIRGRGGEFETQRRTGRAVKVGKETFYLDRAPGGSTFSWSITDPVSGYAVAVGKNAKDALASLKQRVANYGGAAGFLKIVKEARREIFGQVARPNPGSAHYSIWANRMGTWEPVGTERGNLFKAKDLALFVARSSGGFGRTVGPYQTMMIKRMPSGKPIMILVREMSGSVENWTWVKPNPGADTDTGSDPLGDGTFKMFPSGDIVSFDERNRRLERFHRPKELRPGVFGKSWEQIAEMQGGSETLDITRHKRKKNPGAAWHRARAGYHHALAIGSEKLGHPNEARIQRLLTYEQRGAAGIPPELEAADIKSMEAASIYALKASNPDTALRPGSGPSAADKAYRAFHDRNPDRAVKTKAPASFPRKLWMLGKLHKVTDRSGRVMLTGGILAAGRFGAAPLFILGARAHGAAGRFTAGMTEYIPQRPSKRVGPIYFHEHSGRRPVIVTRAAPGYYKVAGGGLRITRRGIVG